MRCCLLTNVIINIGMQQIGLESDDSPIRGLRPHTYVMNTIYMYSIDFRHLARPLTNHCSHERVVVVDNSFVAGTKANTF